MAFWNWVPSQLKNPCEVPLLVLPEGDVPGPAAGWLGWKYAVSMADTAPEPVAACAGATEGALAAAADEGKPTNSNGPATLTTLATASLRDSAGDPTNPVRRVLGRISGVTFGPSMAYLDHGVWSATASTRSRAVATGSMIAPASLSQWATRHSSSRGTPT
jgi:hypothetical protein